MISTLLTAASAGSWPAALVLTVAVIAAAVVACLFLLVLAKLL